MWGRGGERRVQICTHIIYIQFQQDYDLLISFFAKPTSGAPAPEVENVANLTSLK